MSDKYSDLTEKALVLWLKEDQDIEAVSAWFDETNIPAGGGCDTCGYGGDNDLSFDIRYKPSENEYSKCHTIDGDPLNFFSKLYPYMVRVDVDE